jgi:polyisoprenoid-binding protein YceI
MWKYGILLLALAVWAGGCSTRLEKPKPATAMVSPALPPVSPKIEGTPVAKRVAPLSAENTRVTFVGTAGKTSHEGTFDQLTGQWDLPTDDPKDSRLAVRIDVNSLRTQIALLTLHLKRSDFLDAKQFPTATFESTRIDPESGPGGTTHRVTGVFTIHGVARTLTFPARVILGPDVATFDATFPIGQTAFGMTTGAEKANDEVPVTVAVNARRQ